MGVTPSAESSSCDLLISGGRILDLAAGSGVLDDAAVAVRDAVIVGLGPRSEVESSWSPTRVIDATGQVIAPGFIDAQVHLAAFLNAGRPYQPSAGPGPFSGAGRPEVVLPMVARWCSMAVPGELVAAVVGPPLAAMLKAGITSVVDAGGPGVDGVVSAAAELGIRAAIGPSLADMWHDEQGVLTRQVVSAVETMAHSDEFRIHSIRADARRADASTRPRRPRRRPDPRAGANHGHQHRPQRGTTRPPCTVAAPTSPQ